MKRRYAGSILKARKIRIWLERVARVQSELIPDGAWNHRPGTPVVTIDTLKP